MVFHGLSPMGCIPSQRVKARDGGCLGYVNDYVRQFNSRVKNLIAGLNSNLPAAQMAFADCYSIVLDLINNPQVYGRTSFKSTLIYVQYDTTDALITWFSDV